MLRPQYPILTERLMLRPWRVGELDRYHALRAIPEVATYLYDEPLTRRQAAERLRGLRSDITEVDRWMNVAVELADPGGVVVGDVGLCWRSEVHRQAEIGYVLDPAYQGRGFATEAAAAMIELAISGLGAHRVCGRLDARNTASARVLARLGMRYEAHLVENEFVKGEWVDEMVFATLAREWREAQDASPAGLRPPRQ
jgi:RimJ/RimL family protein N-acetyltransferase